MLDSPDSVCAGQVGFEYPATFVLFSKLNAIFAVAFPREVT
jgi:hypothetical protein